MFSSQLSLPSGARGVTSSSLSSAIDLRSSMESAVFGLDEERNIMSMTALTESRREQTAFAAAATDIAAMCLAFGPSALSKAAGIRISMFDLFVLAFNVLRRYVISDVLFEIKIGDLVLGGSKI